MKILSLGGELPAGIYHGRVAGAAVPNASVVYHDAVLKRKIVAIALDRKSRALRVRGEVFGRLYPRAVPYSLYWSQGRGRRPDVARNRRLVRYELVYDDSSATIFNPPTPLDSDEVLYGIFAVAPLLGQGVRDLRLIASLSDCCGFVNHNSTERATNPVFKEFEAHRRIMTATVADVYKYDRDRDLKRGLWFTCPAQRRGIVHNRPYNTHSAAINQVRWVNGVGIEGSDWPKWHQEIGVEPAIPNLSRGQDYTIPHSAQTHPASYFQNDNYSVLNAYYGGRFPVFVPGDAGLRAPMGRAPYERPPEYDPAEPWYFEDTIRTTVGPSFNNGYVGLSMSVNNLWCIRDKAPALTAYVEIGEGAELEYV